MYPRRPDWSELRLRYAAALAASPDPLGEAWYVGAVLEPHAIDCANVALMRRLHMWACS